MGDHFMEASGNLQDWPRNVPDKPTHAAVFGLYHPDKGKVCEILWTGEFENLDKAMYWAAKEEVKAVRKGKWNFASRVLWQHDLTAEQAVAACAKVMGPQIDRALGLYNAGLEPELGPGPMKPIDYSKPHKMYVEVSDADGNDVFPGAVIDDPLSEPDEEPPYQRN
jgi:hypothetical protein